MIWDSKQIEEALNVKLNLHSKFGQAQFNSKDVKKGDIFIALKGMRDGHEFVPDAIDKGAGLIIVSKQLDSSHLYDKDSHKLVYVPDCMEALKKLAQYKRRNSKAKFIAITGSVGKTTTKEALHFTLSKFTNSFASRANFNNLLGVLINLASIPENATHAIIEVGMNQAGEIKMLSELIKPDIAIITSISEAHMVNFDSDIMIAHAKSEIFYGLNKNNKNQKDDSIITISKNDIDRNKNNESESANKNNENITSNGDSDDMNCGIAVINSSIKPHLYAICIEHISKLSIKHTLTFGSILGQDNRKKEEESSSQESNVEKNYLRNDILGKHDLQNSNLKKLNLDVYNQSSSDTQTNTLQTNTDSIDVSFIKPVVYLKYMHHINTRRTRYIYSLYGTEVELVLDDIPVYIAQNFAACLLVANYYKYDIQEVKIALEQFQLGVGRGKIIELQYQNKKIQIICDYYNANPESMMASLQHFAKIHHDNKIVILGDMNELGKSTTQHHSDIASVIVSTDIKNIILIGKHVKVIFDALQNILIPSQNKMLKLYDNIDELLMHIDNFIQDKQILLIKGSRANKLEKIVQYFGEHNVI